MATSELRLTNSQIELLWKIQNRIANGNPRLTVLDPFQKQWQTMGLCVASWFHNQGSVLLVCNSEDEAEKCATWIYDNELDDVDAVFVDAITSESVRWIQYLVFLDIDITQRDKVIDACNGYTGVAISFGSKYSRLDGNTNRFPYTFIFPTQRIVDVRDAVCADEKEKKKLKRDCEKKIAELVAEIDPCSEGTMDQFEKVNRNSFDFYDVISSGDRSVAVNCMDCYQLELDQKNAEIAFLYQIIESLGINAADVKRIGKQIEKTRSDLHEDLSSEDEATKERAEKAMQDAVSAAVMKISKSRKLCDVPRCKEYLIKNLTEHVWNYCLSEESKSFLITAKVMFDSMDREDESLDYSGVCVLVTKALEVEVTRRFFLGYVDYLKKSAIGIKKWPRAILDSSHEKLISENDFMLGTLFSMMGLSRVSFYNGQFETYKVKYEWLFTQYKNFAKELYNNSDCFEEKLNRDLHDIEKVRIDYRNPAAHKDRLMRITAKDCLNYVAGAEKLLKTMLSDMNPLPKKSKSI